MMTVGAVISMTGNNVGGALAGSRMLYALSEQGDLPNWFGRVHPTFRTPTLAIVVTSAVTWGWRCSRLSRYWPRPAASRGCWSTPARAPP